MWPFRRKPREIKVVEEHIIQRLEKMQETQQQILDQMTDGLWKNALASETIRKTIAKESQWHPIPLPPSDVLFQEIAGQEIHDAILLPLVPDYQLILTLSNPLFHNQSATYLVIPKWYVRVLNYRLPSGKDGLAVKINLELAPPAMSDALALCMAQENEDIWLTQFTRTTPMGNASEINTHEYRLCRDLTVDEAGSWREQGTLFFDCSVGYERTITINHWNEPASTAKQDEA